MKKIVATQTGWNAFRLLWAGQSLSLLGTGMTRFAVLIWAYQKAGTATALALLGFFATLAYVVISPFAGVLVDRWDRRKVMFLSDLGAGMMTGLLLALNTSGHLQIWHLYLAESLAGAFEAFQQPAFSASVSLLVPREAYTRANGLLGLGSSAARMFAPALAGLLLPFAGLNAVMLVDLSSLCLALGGLLVVYIPAPALSPEGAQASGNFWHELRYGAGYILHRPGLASLLFTFFLINLFGTLTYFAVLPPMILSRTGGDEGALSIVRTVMGLGGILGGILISAWGGTRRKARTYLVASLLSFLVCDFMIAVSRSVAGWSIAGFLAEFSIPFIVSPYYALWQELVPPDVQGRVFATRETVQVFSQPAGFLSGGLLADRLFEPALQPDGWLTGSAGLLVGSGPGAGMSAMFLGTCLLGSLTGVLGLLLPAIRSLEEKVPVTAELAELPTPDN
jgi:DHA3 family macrolide efflux protein-like MFS transporter